MPRGSTSRATISSARTASAGRCREGHDRRLARRRHGRRRRSHASPVAARPAVEAAARRAHRRLARGRPDAAASEASGHRRGPVQGQGVVAAARRPVVPARGVLRELAGLASRGSVRASYSSALGTNIGCQPSPPVAPVPGAPSRSFRSPHAAGRVDRSAHEPNDPSSLASRRHRLAWVQGDPGGDRTLFGKDNIRSRIILWLGFRRFGRRSREFSTSLFGRVVALSDSSGLRPEYMSLSSGSNPTSIQASSTASDARGSLEECGTTPAGYTIAPASQHSPRSLDHATRTSSRPTGPSPARPRRTWRTCCRPCFVGHDAHERACREGIVHQDPEVQPHAGAGVLREQRTQREPRRHHHRRRHRGRMTKMSASHQRAVGHRSGVRAKAWRSAGPNPVYGRLFDGTVAAAGSGSAPHQDRLGPHRARRRRGGVGGGGVDAAGVAAGAAKT